MAFVADIRMVANLWLRSGSSHSANNALAFLNDLDQRGIHYLIALRLNQPLQRVLVEETGWWVLDDSIELIDFDYQAPSWEKPRRVVGIRQKIDEVC